MSKKAIDKTRNTSLILPKVIRKISEVKHISVEEIEKVTTENKIKGHEDVRVSVTIFYYIIFLYLQSLVIASA